MKVFLKTRRPELALLVAFVLFCLIYVASGANSTIESYVSRINVTRWIADDQKISSYSRYAQVSNPGAAGIGQAQTWLVNTMTSLGLSVTTRAFTFSTSFTGYNVVGVLNGNGTSSTSKIVIVGAHYDSTSEIPTTSAPGAIDNGSGVAMMLEIARVYSAEPPSGTEMQFIAFSAEEEGLYGSYAFVNNLNSADKARISSVLILDMAGWRQGSSNPAALLESSSANSKLLDLYASAGKQYGSSSFSTSKSFNPFGSDHIPFINAGIPCLLVIDYEWDKYPYYHKSNDLASNLVSDQGENLLRMNVAALYNLTVNNADVSLVSAASNLPALILSSIF